MQTVNVPQIDLDCLNQLSKAAPIGVAVSGGGDSMALLKLLSDWGRTSRQQFLVVSVDHGLRANSGQECLAVREFAESCGHRHSTLRWNRPENCGNLQHAARDARYRLIAEWAGKKGIEAVALGHTKDDQAETVLLNLARGSGVDGLAGMPSALRKHGVTWLRPMLAVSRRELRNFLRDREIAWIDDPSNDDLAFSAALRREGCWVQCRPWGCQSTGWR